MNEIAHCPRCGHHLNPDPDAKTAYCPVCDDEVDVPRYRKKSMKTGLKRSKHKHQYEPCLLELDNFPDFKTGRVEGTHIAFQSYCTVCGKIGDCDVGRWFVNRITPFYEWISEGYTEEAERELDPATRTLPLFRVYDKYFPKFVELKEGKADEE